jgi:hypothetical protein
MKGQRKIVALAALLALLLSVSLVASSPLATVNAELLGNGGFEGGFTYLDGCGMVGQGWQCFSNGGTAAYGFYDEMWDPVVWDGEHSQLIEINTRQIGGDPDRYAGIYQTVDVLPGGTYTFSIHGMLRADDEDPDPWRYRVQVGFDHSGGSDWSAVTNWIELPWDDYYPRTSPGSFSDYGTTVQALGNRLTVFVRVWMKWGTWYRELDVNIDGISLYGPMPYVEVLPECCIDWTTGAVMHIEDAMQIAAASQCALYGYPTGTYFCNEDTATWWIDLDADAPGCMPACVVDVNYGTAEINWRCTGVLPPSDGVEPDTVVPESLICDGPDALVNGDFESGFYNGVGNGWGSFDNNGAAGYGFYDEMWSPVVAAGAHSQLIEISTLGLAASDSDRYAGIYQTVWGLWPGETYELSLYGMIRQGVSGWEGDPYRYRVQWGYTADGSTDWTQVSNWQEIPWNTIYPRTEPGDMALYTVQFQAPSSQITLFVRAWKKWGTAQEEMDVNLDEIALHACWPAEPWSYDYEPCDYEPYAYEPCPYEPCDYAYDYDSIWPSDPLYPSEELPPLAETQCWTHVIQRGDTLSAIAAAYGSTVATIIADNAIANPNVIYVGHELLVCVP